MTRNLSAAVLPGIKTPTTTLRDIHNNQQPRPSLTDNQILKSPDRQQLYALENPLQLSLSLPPQSSQSTLPNANTSPELESLKLPITRKRRRILSKDDVGSDWSLKLQTPTPLAVSKAVQYPLQHSLNPLPVLTERDPTSSISQSQIEAWIHQTETETAKTTAYSNSLKRKRCSPSPVPGSVHTSPASRHSGENLNDQTGSMDPRTHNVSEDGFQSPATPAQTLSSKNPFSTPTTSSKTKTRVPTDDDWVSQCLDKHGMFFGSKKELDKYPDFKNLVESIITSERGSSMKPQSVQRFLDRRDYYHNSNEDTILQELIPLIIKQDYMRKLDQESEEFRTLNAATERADGEGSSLLEGQQWVCSEWFADGVAVTTNVEFRKTLLPNKYPEELEPKLVKALAKDDGMKNPKPDKCYGLRLDKFPVPSNVMLSSEVRYLLQVVPSMEHAFFLIEGKSNKGNVGEAENQARRGGATLVNAARRLLEHIGEPDISGVDHRTFVFSATMTSGLMTIYVNWAEVDNGQELFHMTRLKSRSLLDDEGALPDIRATVHNILSWGCTERFSYLTTVRTGLYAFQLDENARLVGEAKVKKGNKKRRLDDGASNAEGA